MLTLGCAHKEQLVDPTAEENVPETPDGNNIAVNLHTAGIRELERQQSAKSSPFS